MNKNVISNEFKRSLNSFFPQPEISPIYLLHCTIDYAHLRFYVIEFEAHEQTQI